MIILAHMSEWEPKDIIGVVVAIIALMISTVSFIVSRKAALMPLRQQAADIFKRINHVISRSIMENPIRRDELNAFYDAIEEGKFLFSDQKIIASKLDWIKETIEDNAYVCPNKIENNNLVEICLLNPSTKRTEEEAEEIKRKLQRFKKEFPAILRTHIDGTLRIDNSTMRI